MTPGPVRGCLVGLALVLPVWLALGLAVYWLGHR
jgi:hypothetical protein